MTYYRKINDVEFDHVFTILSGGTITDGPAGMYAPDSHDGELSGDGWEYLDGYSGQYGYAGPIMHESEYIGGSMERDMIRTPGIYAVVADYTDGEDDGESDITGWAVVRYTGNLPVRGRYIGTWWGGHSYAQSEWTDAEWFGSLSDAATALRQRHESWFTADYVMRRHDDTRCPCAHSEWEGGITLWNVSGESITTDDVERIVTTEYPDRLVEFGPRGGIRINLT